MLSVSLCSSLMELHGVLAAWTWAYGQDHGHRQYVGVEARGTVTVHEFQRADGHRIHAEQEVFGLLTAIRRKRFA